MQDLNNIIESLLFVAEEPLTVEKLRGILETVDSKEIRSTLQTLADEYEQRGGGFWLREVAGGWQIRSRPDYHEWIKRMLQPSPQRLSRAALETLAVVAYKQPIIRADIEHIRGVDCGGVLRQLMERKLVRVLGRKEIAGRPLIYATTKLFLEMFELKDLNDLPTPREIAEFGNMPTDQAQKDSQDSASDTTELADDGQDELGAQEITSAADEIDNQTEQETAPLDHTPSLPEASDVAEEEHSTEPEDTGLDEFGVQEIASVPDESIDNENDQQTATLDHQPLLSDTENVTEENPSMAPNQSDQNEIEVSSGMPAIPQTEHSFTDTSPEEKDSKKEMIDSSDGPLDGEARTSTSEEDDNSVKNT